MSMKKIIFLIIISLIFVSCNNSENKEKPIEKKPDSNQVEENSGNTNKFSDKINQQIKLIQPEKLAEFLPLSIPKAEKYPSSSGFQIWNDKQISSASAEYVFKPGGIVIIINDYGTYGNIPPDDLIFIKKYSQQQEGNVQKLILPDGVGYQKWDDVTDSGILEALLFNRFIVRIEGIKLEEKYQNLSDFYHFINIKNIEKELKK